MKILDRYIIKIFLKYLSMSLAFMSCLFLFQAMFTDLYNHSFPLHQIFIYYAYDIPLIIIQMTAPSTLMATALTGASLSRSKELIACFALGMSLTRITRYCLLCVIFLCGAVFIAEDHILPYFYKKRSSYYWKEIKKQNDFFLDVKTEKIWYRSKNLIYNLKFFDPIHQTILGLGVYTFDKNFHLIKNIEAQKAVFNGKKWQLFNGTIITYPLEEDFPHLETFESTFIDIAETPKEFQETEKEVDGLNIKQMRQYIKQMKRAGINSRHMEVKYHSRFSLSLIPFIMSLVALPFSFSVARRISIAFNIGTCLGLTFLYWFAFSVSLSLGSKGILDPIPAAWIPSLTFGCLAMILTIQKKF